MTTTRVVCTAGHVDHGKSRLLTALTGQQPDRLAEEQRRGLTLDLGFAWTTLEGPPGTTPVRAAFVDLPGHERFVPTMLAGAGPVRTALFVVAADEGWMPQSAEHLAILDLLGVSGAVVALTRSDLVDAETAEIGAELLREQLDGTALADAPVVVVSAVTGAGLPELRRVLHEVLSAAPAPPDLGRPRLWVDRSFSIRGAGTVVTGTLTGGRVAVGDHLVVQPGGVPVRVRGLQALGEDVPVADAGSRVAMNLVGVDAAAVERGDAITGGDWVLTDAVEAWCRPVPGEVLGRRGSWRLHVGSASAAAALYPVAGVDLDRPGPVRIELDRALPLAVGDRVVLRESGRSATVGGGVVLEPSPGPRVRGTAARRERLARLAGPHDLSTAAARLAIVVAGREATGRQAALAAADAAPDVGLPASVVALPDHLVQADRFLTWADVAVGAVTAEHERRPIRAAVDPSVPRRALEASGCPPDVADGVVARLLADGRLVQRPGGVAAPGHVPRMTDVQGQSRQDLLALLDRAGTNPPTIGEVREVTGADPDLLDALTREGAVVPLAGIDAMVSRQVLEQAGAALRDLQAREGPFTAGQARTALGTSRKYALPLLEALDAAGVTRRDGDLRTVEDA